MTQTDHHTLTRYTYEGLSLLTRDSEWDRGISREVWHEYWWDRVQARPVKTALDIGAHIGAWTLSLKHFHPAAQVVAVEINMHNAQILAKNLSDVDGAHALHRRVGYAQGGGLVASHRVNTGGGYAVTTEHATTLNDAWSTQPAPPDITVERILDEYRLPQIDLLKIDAEGSEYDILSRMHSSTLHRVGVIVGEHHGTRDHFDARVGGRLREHGFVIDYKPSQVDELGMFWAVRDSA